MFMKTTKISKISLKGSMSKFLQDIFQRMIIKNLPDKEYLVVNRNAKCDL